MLFLNGNNAACYPCMLLNPSTCNYWNFSMYNLAILMKVSTVNMGHVQQLSASDHVNLRVGFLVNIITKISYSFRQPQ